MELDLVEHIANVMQETAEAHHIAFSDTDGEDPDWAIWYADHLRDKLCESLHASMTKSEVIYLLVTADKEQNLVAPGADWTRYYANFFLERYIV